MPVYQCIRTGHQVHIVSETTYLDINKGHLPAYILSTGLMIGADCFHRCYQLVEGA